LRSSLRSWNHSGGRETKHNIDRLNGGLSEERWRRLDGAWEGDLDQLREEQKNLEQALTATASDDAA